MITIIAYDWVPDFAKGYVRDLRVRWALEEAVLPYRVRLIGHDGKLTRAYRSLQRFSQVPVYQEGDLTLFESGAIVLHIAAQSAALMPSDEAGRLRATSWLIAALNSIEPFVAAFEEIEIFHPDAPWANAVRPMRESKLRNRLSGLAERLAGREWLEDRFTAGDLMMATMLRIVGNTDLVKSDPVLGPQFARCEARPAFRKALADQLASFRADPGAAD